MQRFTVVSDRVIAKLRCIDQDPVQLSLCLSITKIV